VKKYFQNNFRASENLELNQRQNKQNKTTDINILLNRVKLDRKKTFQKRILVSLIFLLLLSSIIAYVII